MQVTKAIISTEGDKKLTVGEAAARLGLQPVTLRAWAARRTIAVYKLGRAVRIDEREVERILRESLIPAVES